MSDRLRQLPVQISVQACAQSIKLEQFLRWCPGTILSFDQLAKSPMHVRIGQRDIGDCHAVKAGEKLAIQISKMNSEHK